MRFDSKPVRIPISFFNLMELKIMNILSVFETSPFKPVQQHMIKVHQCVALLPLFLDAIYAKDWLQAQTLQQQIDQFEIEADEIRQEILNHFSSDLFKPLSCEDVLELICAQYKIAAAVKDVCGMIIERKLEIPSGVAMNYYGFTNACIAVAQKAKAAVDEMDCLFEGGQWRIHTSLIQQIRMELAQLERDTRQIFIEMRTQMAAIEKVLPAVEVTFLFKIFEGTEKIADKAQQVGHRLHMLSAA